MYRVIPLFDKKTFKKVILNIKVFIISFVSLYGISKYSVWNVVRRSEFSEHSIRRRVCQVQGEFFGAETHTKLIKCINNNCLYS